MSPAGHGEPDLFPPFAARFGVHTGRQPVYPCGAIANFNAYYDKSWGAFIANTHPTIGRPGHRARRRRATASPRTATSNTSARAHSRMGRAATTTSTLPVATLPLARDRPERQLPDDPLLQGLSAGALPQERDQHHAERQLHHGDVAPAVFSGSSLNGHSAYKPFWDDLYAAHAALVLNGHAHYYERYKPQNPSGAVDPANGITEMIVGTGGINHGSAKVISPNTAVYNNESWGAIFLTSAPRLPSHWQFVNEAGQTVDSGTRSCTPRPSSPARDSPVGDELDRCTLGICGQRLLDRARGRRYRRRRAAGRRRPSPAWSGWPRTPGACLCAAARAQLGPDPRRGDDDRDDHEPGLNVILARVLGHGQLGEQLLVFSMVMIGSVVGQMGLDRPSSAWWRRGRPREGGRAGRGGQAHVRAGRRPRPPWPWCSCSARETIAIDHHSQAVAALWLAAAGVLVKSLR